jgi:uncharacterized membrane protein YqjE
MEDSSPAQGFRGSLRQLANSLLSALHNRVELFAIEFREEKQWLVGTLLWCAGAMFFAFAGVLMLIATVLFFCPEAARPWVLLGFSLLFLVGAFLCGLRLRNNIASRTPFEATLGEIEKDIDWVRTAGPGDALK